MDRIVTGTVLAVLLFAMLLLIFLSLFPCLVGGLFFSDALLSAVALIIFGNSLLPVNL